MVFRARPPKPDANQAQLTEELRKLPGVSAIVLNADIDLIVGYQGRNFLLEVKNPELKWNANRRTERQKQLRATWTGQYAVVKSLDEVLAVIGY